ncbi:saccharopine dehydrogenase family protein [Lysinibacillus sp. NPDC096418]|uniref:saccharopine dehydrogenase family protein n=1 Tax=Lysinibacillus sp. NPDC096418 TaxID=3364138 RepID=UPI003809BD19
MKDKILVVGGYGQVGKIVCHSLSQLYSGKVICSGRNFSKAREFSIETNGAIIPKQLDIYTIKQSDKIFNDTGLVIMCLDQKDTRFVEICIENEINYIDISPSYKLLSKVEKLNDKAKEFGTTIVLGVGLAPGLSNLLVKQSIKQFDKISSVDMYLMLGIGERHGRDGVEWLLNSINSSFYALENNSPKLMNSFSDGKKTKLSEEHGFRTAYRFDLAD